MNLYKSELLPYLTFRTAAMHHACDTVLAPLDSFQTRFLSELGISKEDALFQFNLASLSCRWDIAMLWLLHRCALRKGLEHFHDLFKVSAAPRCNTRSGSRMHGRQLVDIRNRQFLEIERRSALGLIWIYNRVPEAIGSNDTVKDFQGNLQLLLKELITSGCTDWKITFSQRIPYYLHPVR